MYLLILNKDRGSVVYSVHIFGNSSVWLFSRQWPYSVGAKQFGSSCLCGPHNLTRDPNEQSVTKHTWC